MSESAPSLPLAVKDLEAQHPIAGAWRPVLREVVRRFVAGDFGLAKSVPGVEPVSAKTVEQIVGYLADYGATLVDLPEDTWHTSVAQWMETHWDILVDLWTAEEGPSDLVLQGRVVETGAGPRLTIRMVYVP